MGVGETGVGETGVGEHGISPSVIQRCHCSHLRVSFDTCKLYQPSNVSSFKTKTHKYTNQCRGI